MYRFLQLHLLTSYPPANLNRDDLGRPKTAVMGGTMRLRVSSQSIKRAWRQSEVFQTALAGYVGVRTKEKGKQVYQELMNGGVREKEAREWAGKIAAQFGKLPPNALEIEQLAHFSPDEEQAIRELIGVLTVRGSGPTDDELKLLRKHHSAADIALFGRMLADSPAFNMEASAQVAHAIGVHRCQVEDDFFTAVDDLNDGRENRGSAHMGATEFGAALFYLYVCLDRKLLLDNLNGDRELVNKTIDALLQCAATVAPTGKQNSFASRAYASYILAEKGDRQPRSLAVAFLKPVTGDDMLPAAILAMERCFRNMDQVYGVCADVRYDLNAHSGQGELSALQAFGHED